MKIKKYLTRKKVLMFLIIIALIVSSLIPLIRIVADKPILIGEKSYYDLRMGKAILEKGIIFEDNLIFEGRDYTAKPYHIILAGFSYFFNEIISSIIFSLILSLLILILFYLILRQFKLKLDKIFFILLVFVLSPIFIFTSGTINEVSVSLFLLFLGTYLFQRKNTPVVWPLIVFLLSTLFNLINIFIILFLLIFISENYIEKKKDSNLIITFVFMLAVIYYAPLYLNNNIITFIEMTTQNNFVNFISDLGAQIGISIFALILGLIGILRTWEYKHKLKNIYLLMAILFFIGFYINYTNIYLNVFFSIFAGLTLTRIINMKWEAPMLKRVMILLLIYGLLFSSISYIKRVSELGPDRNIQESLEWLGENSEKDEIVFSHYSKGLWIEYWSDLPVITDSLFNYDNVYQRLSNSNELFYSRNLEKTKILLNNYNITYIYIDNSMKEGQVWDKKEGLWYSFRNNETFNNIYKKNGIEIWEVYFR
jgi:hypothetical protein